MKKYKVLRSNLNPKNTEKELNEYAAMGWTITCSYSGGNWFVLEKEVEEMDIELDDFEELEDLDMLETKTEKKAKRNKAHPYSRTSRGKHSIKR